MDFSSFQSITESQLCVSTPSVIKVKIAYLLGTNVREPDFVHECAFSPPSLAFRIWYDCLDKVR